jgi:hypothetical protein
MKKLRLDLDGLRVDSFEARADTGDEGTVHAHDDGATCSKQPTCGIASRGEETYGIEAITRYACCV